MYVEMELSRVLITEYGGDQLIFLREKGGKRTFPIVIGIGEAMAIHRRLNGERTPRPMTHDLMANVIREMGGRLEKIVVEDLRFLSPDDSRQTFIATLYIRQNDHLLEVDSRPSDAIALGSALDTPIFVAEKVLDTVLTESTQDRVGMLREHMEVLMAKITDLSERLTDKDFLDHAPEPILTKLRHQLDQMKTEYEAIDRVLKMLG
ncbi:MAG TPA: bifunctional nuclease family protein [Phycisphaerae bacterium]|nr:bifunctional nuclease family protein [Phycisphaerae bacterium]